jgi:hypothetical protein
MYKTISCISARRMMDAPRACNFCWMDAVGVNSIEDLTSEDLHSS